jgi:cytochrome b involved in lipid metabolism
MSTLPDFAEEEVEKHKFEDDCWVIVDGAVYDVTPFLNEHPGYDHSSCRWSR